jgi:3-oxoacyl-[acyl-carrier protein] reductase
MKQTHTPVAAIFAASGAIAGGVAKELASQGVHVFVSARDEKRAAALAQQIRQAGGTADSAQVDACVDAEVSAWLDHVVRKTDRLDVVFNGIGGEPKSLNYPARSDDQSLNDFLVPMQRIVGSQFLTSRHAAKRMAHKKSGAVVTLSATLSSMTVRHMAGIAAACGAVESMTRALAGDYGPSGVRVNCVRGSAMPETRTIALTSAGLVALGDGPQMEPPPLGRPVSVLDTAKAVAFMALNGSSGMTGQVVTVCGGQFVG